LDLFWEYLNFCFFFYFSVWPGSITKESRVSRENSAGASS
jgi:hypothetical protein